MKSIEPLYEVHFNTPGFDGTVDGWFVGTYAECEALADKTAGKDLRLRARFSIVPVEIYI